MLLSGTNHKSNPNAMETVKAGNTIFTNVAQTSDGGLFWEGLEKEVDLDKVSITSWKNKPWKKGDAEKAAHPNSRYLWFSREMMYRQLKRSLSFSTLFNT
jgi:phosphoenolpyruvate carboxykinase (GTP)